MEYIKILKSLGQTFVGLAVISTGVSIMTGNFPKLSK